MIFFKVLPSLGKFELAILSDVIEHFTKEQGLILLTKLFEHVEDVVIATPHGFRPHPAIGENTHEEHKSGWEVKDFERFTIIDKAIIQRIRKDEEVLVVYLRK